MTEFTKKTDYTAMFEYQTLAKIHGEPDYEQLKTMKDKLKTNASKIQSELGGGGHGHLGLVLSPTEYTNISQTPYVRPLHPGVLNVAPNCTERVESRRRIEHKRDLALFHETVQVENALKKQITESVDELYLEELRDTTTNTILSSIPFILNHLITNYGEIEPDTVTDKEMSVRKMDFTVADPLTKLWKEVEDIEALSIAASAKYSEQQLVNIALHVIKSTRDFERGLNDWYVLPTQNQTWLHLKTHFQSARRNLKKSRGNTLRAAGYHQANQITDEIQEVQKNIQSMQEAQQSVLSAIEENQNMMSMVVNHMGYHDGRESFVPPQLIEETTPPPTQQANAVVPSDISTAIKEMADEISFLKRKIGNMNAEQPPHFTPNFQSRQQGGRGNGRGGGRESGRGRGRDRGRGRGGGRGRGQQQQRYNNQSKYCHSHGACNHPSWFCQTPGENHQWNATLDNKMGGSTKNCQ